MSISRKLRTIVLVFVGGTVLTAFLVFERYQSHFPNVVVEKYRKGQIKRDLFTYPNSWKLIDLEMEYLINNLVCSNYGESDNISILILITSHSGDIKMRGKIREMFSTNELKRLKVRRLFLLAKNEISENTGSSKYQSVTFEEILEESHRHGDILMGNFKESYRNLTYKHLMGLQWVNRYCSDAHFILKQDDDIIVDYYQVLKLLNSKEYLEPLVEEKYIFGKILDHQPIIRDPNSKWYVPENEFHEEIDYPPFVSGWAYMTTPKVAAALVNISHYSNYFWIDDAFITGYLRERAGINLIDMGEIFTVFKGQLQCCIAKSKYSTSTDHQPYWCDFIVGPSNDDLELMGFFQKHARFCHVTNTCLMRQGRQRLKHSCVITDSMTINHFVNFKEINVKRKGLWRRV